MEKISIIGLGYIGLPTACLFASKGFEVIGVDVRKDAVDAVNRGKAHIYEPGLEEVLNWVVKNGKLSASTNPQAADVFIIAVPTPFKEGHAPDLSYVESATRSIAPVLRPGNLVILESTSPVGTTEKIGEWIRQERKDLHVPQWDQSNRHLQPVRNNEIFLAHCPERVLPGKIMTELLQNDRVIGGINRKSTQKARLLYQSVVQGKIHETNCRTAEMTKLVENAYRDVNIAFANELSMVCADLDVDVWKVIEFANKHPRVKILQPGPGVGGHCIAVDPWFLVHSCPDSAKLIRTAREVNDSKVDFVVKQITSAAKTVRNPTIACLGLAFKANIDDLRGSPAIEVVEKVANLGLDRILVVEPFIRELPKELKNCKGVELVDLSKALDSSNVVALLVDHSQFSSIGVKDLERKSVIDTRGVFKEFNLPLVRNKATDEDQIETAANCA